MITAAILIACAALCAWIAYEIITPLRLKSFNVGDLIAITGGEFQGRIGVVTFVWVSQMRSHAPMQYNGVSFDLQHRIPDTYRGDASIWQVKKIG